jgi:hypothetical protein
MQFRENPIFFVVDVKKIKEISQKNLFLALNFVIFTQVKLQVDFSWKDFVRTYHVKMYTWIFYLKFFDISKCIKIAV